MESTLVYIIDDEPESVKLIAEIVTHSGFTPKSFTSAKTFFENTKFFDVGSLLALDLQMPDMDGIEVMRQLAQMPSPPALILISGSDEGVLNSAEKLGRAHHLNILASITKPFNLFDFQELLVQHKNQVRHQSKDQSTYTLDNIYLSDISNAIINNQLVLHYQPQFDIKTRKAVGAEALVRWQHPKYGLVPPNHFIPLLEKGGLMGDLTHWVINRCVQQTQEWEQQGLSIPISVNISASDITELTLPEQLSHLLDQNRLDPVRLTLEVTESALMGELVTSLDILTRIRLKGFGLSIDDFGTGYSSLSQLHRIPFTELKIDRSFISNLHNDSEARAIVKTCIMLGHELNMTTVAEGVEEEEQFTILKELNCDTAQGYLLSKPVPASEITRLIS